MVIKTTVIRVDAAFKGCDGLVDSHISFNSCAAVLQVRVWSNAILCYESVQLVFRPTVGIAVFFSTPFLPRGFLENAYLYLSTSSGAKCQANFALS